MTKRPHPFRTGALVAVSGATTAVAGPNLRVGVENFGSREGKLCAALYAADAGFPSDESKAVRKFCVDASDGGKGLLFENVPPGTYAAALYHDKNSDGKLNTGLFGIPKEGFGFSNNPVIRMGAPSFRDCAFKVNEADANLQIELKNL